MSDTITVTEEKVKAKMPHVDFSYQINLCREKVEKKIFQHLCEISKKLYIENKRVGAIIVLGCFTIPDDHVIFGMRQLSNNRIQKYLNIMFAQHEQEVARLFEEGHDGAIIINQDGQILGTNIYLVTDNYMIDIPEGCATRHISAASFSIRDDVIATYTLSEETLAVRKWVNGVVVDQFLPTDEEENPK